MKSGNIINYSTRTAKSVERRMLLDAIRALFKDVKIVDRRYIGFGSWYFTDFKLFHRDLGINNMISIEGSKNDQTRAEFNMPFKCTKLEMGYSTEVLPTLDWKGQNKDIIWLDYDGLIDNFMFSDCEIVFNNALVGSVYIMTCNKNLGSHSTIAEFRGKFGDLVPIETNNSNLRGDKDFILIREMFLNQINKTLFSRNLSLPRDEKLEFKPLFFFTYKDGAPMVSFGGLLAKKYFPFTLEHFHLNELDFITQNENHYHIDPPLVTYKETILLNSHLPETEAAYLSEISVQFIPEEDRRKYRKLYKYLPNYMDVIY